MLSLLSGRYSSIFLPTVFLSLMSSIKMSRKEKIFQIFLAIVNSGFRQKLEIARLFICYRFTLHNLNDESAFLFS